MPSRTPAPSAPPSEPAAAPRATANQPHATSVAPLDPQSSPIIADHPPSGVSHKVLSLLADFEFEASRSSLPLECPRREAFAQLLARRRVSYAEAARRTGFRPGHGRRMARVADMRTRLAAIVAERAGGGSSDLAFLIDRLIAIGEAAREARCQPAAVSAARAAYEAAAKLKARLPHEPSETAFAADRLAADVACDLTDEEWMARYGAEPPASPEPEPDPPAQSPPASIPEPKR